ncbi:glycosyltransferase [Xanthomonas graminis]|jgi:beta-1,4-mannosyltransferase|uniref:Polysaccharide biosynthesis glycosyltransferase GumI n=1 Tax=Xanthomonas graminis pv. graminis TaxID=134874 RepID=A0A1M4IJ76_9XANT|nr:glycosyltransferase [Xanthomonas translucens]EKU25047.1 mannosyltransferase [Xanthomonas translucens pv. graminis ART-Xtg29]OAX59782.1 GDP-mannose--glycolipid 4-beta-D-mannosyltransferase [Xanthomonas translucens pv. graminis]UKE52949.1 glycosyltransferase [Xanthomonas translucens pv. graminis]WIH10164.1 glycosyltransferase [Xanthomonas translucens pv. graminis]WIH13563.1 glycosyltransferase [Xanthomonas translucens pv. graminis]
MSGEPRCSGDARVPGPPISVLLSTERPTATTNPYLTQLYAALPQQVQLHFFSMRAALLSRYDVLHVHWPEYMMRHPTAVGTLAKQACMALLLLRLKLGGVPLVRTLHNVVPHEDKGWRERLLLRWTDRLTARWIRINATTPERAPATDTILHGHYRDWYAAMPQPPRVPGRLLHFGLLRPYKGVETLVATLQALPDPALSLRIAGNPINAQIRAVVEQACAADPRISARLQYVEDEVLAREVAEAELVVLPYRQMHNSGTLLLALSLARPVLAPWSAANAAIAEEVGPGWVLLYQGELDAAQLADALAQAQRLPADAVPNLSRRDWCAIGLQHYRSYLDARGVRSEVRA